MTIKERAAAWLDEVIRNGEEDPRGKPDCWIVIQQRAAQEFGPPLAVLRSSEGLRFHFPRMAEKAENACVSMSVYAWWFDDEETGT